MFLARVAALTLTGCIIHTNDDPFDSDDDIEEASLQVSPSQLEPGTSALSIQDYSFEVDFEDVRDVRPLSDFEVLEWSSFEDELTLVVSVPDDVRGKQTLAVDFWDGTAYAEFEVY